MQQASTEKPSIKSAPILLTPANAASKCGVSPRKFQQLRKEPWFPPPIVLGPRLLRWSLADLEAAVANMPRQAAPTNEPYQLLRGRVERMKRTGSPS
jgi:predicted DNA-binding transcriptional regulator AlpA